MNYVILTTGRTGSSLLNAHLTQLGAGEPQSWLALHYFDEPITIDGVQAFLETKRVNGILGVKASWWYLYRICEALKIGLKPFFDTCLPNAKFIYIERRNTVHQALSRVKHDMLQRSHFKKHLDFAEYEKQEQPLANREIPIEQITEQLLTTIKDGLGYEALIEKLELYPHRIIFENFIADKEGTCRELLAFLGIPYPDIEISDIYQSTHTSLNDAWHRAFLGQELDIL